jgi:flagellar motor switch protein FliG
LSASQAAPFVWHQHPQTAAAILSQLTAEQAGALLRHFPERQQADVTYRLTTMQDVDASTIERLRASLANILPRSSDAVQSGGARFAAAALTHASEGAERNVLDQMDAQDRMTADAIRGWMFTFEDLSRLSDRELQIWLRQVDQKELVLALKGASEAIQKKILGNMSERVRGFMTEEMGFIGPLPAEEVEAAQLRLMMILRQLEEAGELKIPRHERAFVD